MSLTSRVPPCSQRAIFMQLIHYSSSTPLCEPAFFFSSLMRGSMVKQCSIPQRCSNLCRFLVSRINGKNSAMELFSDHKEVVCLSLDRTVVTPRTQNFRVPSGVFRVHDVDTRDVPIHCKLYTNPITIKLPQDTPRPFSHWTLHEKGRNRDGDEALVRVSIILLLRYTEILVQFGL